MRRILFVTHAAEIGGAEEVLLDLAAHFGPACAQVALFADGKLRTRLDAAGISVTVLPAGARLLDVRRESGLLKMLRSLPALLRLGAQLGRLARGFDVIYANSQKAAVVCLLLRPLVRRPVIWHLHDILSADHFGRWQRMAMVQLANRAASRVIAISQACRGAFIASGGNPARVTAVRSAVDPADFLNATDADAAALRRALGLDEVRLVGLFGRITRWKGQHILIEALTHAANTHALIVGSALFGQAPYEREARQLAERLGVADRVHWLGYRTDVAVLMRSVDVVVHASVCPEPFGRVIVQGLLAARPVLASRHGASAELLGGSSPWLVAPNDPVALAGAIQAVFDTPRDILVQQVAAHRDRVISDFTMPYMMADIEHAMGQAA